MSKLAIDIFTGSGSFGNVAKSFGYEVISLDNRRRKGVCEPTLKVDILKISSSFFKEMNPKIMWFGLPCDSKLFPYARCRVFVQIFQSNNSHHQIDNPKYLRELLPDNRR